MRKILTVLTALCVITASNAKATEVGSESCPGLRKAARAKVVGGWQAKLAHWPGQVALRAHGLDDDKSVYFCGGTLISPMWVLTAAHCIADAGIRCTSGPNKRCRTDLSWSDIKQGNWTGLAGRKIIQVVAGTAQLKASLSAGNVRNVIRTYRHFDYDHDTNRNDIALLKLDKPLNIKPARLSVSAATDPVESLQSSIYMVAGFGHQSRQNRFSLYPAEPPRKFAAGSDVLREVHLPAVPSGRCANRHSAADASGKTQLCAGHEAERKDTCQGDSGGPLVAFDKKGCPYQVGITSYGAGTCAEARSYGVYTRISHFAPWLRAKIGGTPPLATTKGAKAIVAEPVDDRSPQELRDDRSALGAIFDQAVSPDDVLTASDIEAQRTFALAAFDEIRRLFDKASGGKRIKIAIIDENTRQATRNDVPLITGQRTRFRFESEAAGVLVLLEMNAKGQISHLHPTDGTKPYGLLLPAGRAVLFPEVRHGAFQVNPPAGDNRLIALVVPEIFGTEALQKMQWARARTKGLVRPAYVANLLDMIGQAMDEGQATNKSWSRSWAFGEIDYRIEERP